MTGTPPLAHIDWKPCFRIIPSRFPPIGLFDRVAAPEDLEAIIELESMTNPRLRDEIGEIQLVPPEERISGPGTSIIMAAFTHLNPEGSRFTDGSYGVFYAGNDLDTAIGETVYHAARFMRRTKEAPQELDRRVYLVDLDGELHDIRGQHERYPLVYDNENYPPGQHLARTPARTALPTPASADRLANASPSFARSSSPTAARSDISATSGMARRSGTSMKSVLSEGAQCHDGSGEKQRIKGDEFQSRRRKSVFRV
jgi:hypothetical protein